MQYMSFYKYQYETTLKAESGSILASMASSKISGRAEKAAQRAKRSKRNATFETETWRLKARRRRQAQLLPAAQKLAAKKTGTS